jgi:folate-binding protein YgfZ
VTSAAVPAPEGDADSGVPWHYGDPLREQRALRDGGAAVDLSHFGVVRVTGPDRLTWLHSLTTQHLEALLPGASSLALILSPHGHVEHELHIVDDDHSAWIICAPGTAPELVAYLETMKFMTRVEIVDESERQAVVWEPVHAIDPVFPTWLVPGDFAGTERADAGTDKGGGAERYVPERPDVFSGREVIVPRERLAERLSGWSTVAGTWAWNALRVAAAVPRMGFETDHRTLPHEVGWIGPGVHLSKGCYRGQEAVARVHNLGHPPRRLALVHLDGSVDTPPPHGSVIRWNGKDVGWIGTGAQHYEWGPIATVIIKRSVPMDAELEVVTDDGVMRASQTPVVVG